MHDGVDLGGLHDAGQDRIALVGAHVLGALEGHGGLGRVEAHDHLDVGIPLEGLRHAAPPEGAEAGDENSPTQLGACSQPNQMLPRDRSIS